MDPDKISTLEGVYQTTLWELGVFQISWDWSFGKLFSFKLYACLS